MKHLCNPAASRSGRRLADDEVVITPYRDGPLLVRGPFKLQDQDGNVIDVGRKTVALCRCGKSRMRPFCDGTHNIVKFRAPSTLEDGGREQPADRSRFMRQDPDSG